jgi:hypothetical protein
LSLTLLSFFPIVLTSTVPNVRHFFTLKSELRNIDNSDSLLICTSLAFTLALACPTKGATSLSNSELESGDGNTYFLSTPHSNCKGTAVIFAEKVMAFSICLADSIGLAISEYMIIDSFTSFCNGCKGIMGGNYDSSGKVIMINRYKGYLQIISVGGRGLGYMVV